jgi:hypothetical protein
MELIGPTSKRITISYIFNDNLDRVAEIFANPKSLLSISSPWMTEFDCVEGEPRLDKPGSLFSGVWKTIKMLIEVTKSKNTRLYKSYEWDTVANESLFYKTNMNSSKAQWIVWYFLI